MYSLLCCSGQKILSRGSHNISVLACDWPDLLTNSIKAPLTSQELSYFLRHPGSGASPRGATIWFWYDTPIVQVTLCLNCTNILFTLYIWFVIQVHLVSLLICVPMITLSAQFTSVIVIFSNTFVVLKKEQLLALS